MANPGRPEVIPNDHTNPLRMVPSVGSLVDLLAVDEIAPEYLTKSIREELELVRFEIRQGQRFTQNEIADRCREAIARIGTTRFTPVLNGTGVLLHTNLGRSPVSQETAQAMALAASSYLALELAPESNLRGGRMVEIARSMRLLTGAEETLVVNNNAAAVLLTLATLGVGREVIVSRGESVEIGGGFRIPDVIAQSGCRLVEVGTTNRTYVADYRRAAGAETAAFLKVHSSNFRVEGFAATVASSELAELAAETGLPLVEDLGSGALLDTAKYGLRAEPTIQAAIGARVSIVTASGDKLLGGPQAGIICGNRDLIQRIARHPLARAVRADKVTLAGIATTLRHYIRGDAEQSVPIWSMIATSPEGLRRRATAIAEPLGLKIVPSESSIGGGSLPGEVLPSIAIRIDGSHPDDLARKLRTRTPAVFPHIRNNAVFLDMRSILPEQDLLLAAALRCVLA